MLRHPDPELLEFFLESLDVVEAGVLLHLLRCEECAARAQARIAPKPDSRSRETPRRSRRRSGGGTGVK
jgi:hypothetical protein